MILKTAADPAKRAVKSAAISLLVAVLAAAIVPMAAMAEEKPAGWDRPLHGISVAYPDGWTATFDDDTREVQTAVCHTAACETTEETCEVVVPDASLADGGIMNSAWLMPLTIGYDEMMQDALDVSGEGATITRRPTPLGLGNRFWYTTETLAVDPYKSVIRAVAVVEGRYVLVSCWTCDRSADRFLFAHRILETVSVRP